MRINKSELDKNSVKYHVIFKNPYCNSIEIKNELILTKNDQFIFNFDSDCNNYYYFYHGNQIQQSIQFFNNLDSILKMKARIYFCNVDGYMDEVFI